MNIKNQSGFTLIELMVTVAVLAIITAIAVPNFSEQIARYRFNNDVRDFISLLRESRTQAITLKKDVKLNFSKSTTDVDTDTSIYWSPKIAEVSSLSNVEFDMLGKLKTRPLKGCIEVVHKTHSNIKKTITLGVLGGVDAVEENASCS